MHERVSCSFLSNWIERKIITLAKSTTQPSDQSCSLLQWNFAIKVSFLYNIRIFQESDCLFLVYWLEFEIFMYNIWPIVNSQKYNLCRRWNLWKWTVCLAKPAFNMSLKLPRKNPPKPSVVVQGRLRRYSDRMIASCKDLAAECAVSTRILKHKWS